MCLCSCTPCEGIHAQVTSQGGGGPCPFSSRERVGVHLQVVKGWGGGGNPCPLASREGLEGGGGQPLSICKSCPFASREGLGGGATLVHLQVVKGLGASSP